jgi:hypothetical protein
MVELVYANHSSWIVEIVKTLTDRANVTFCLAISLVVVRGGYLELDLKDLDELLLEG